MASFLWSMIREVNTVIGHSSMFVPFKRADEQLEGSCDAKVKHLV